MKSQQLVFISVLVCLGALLLRGTAQADEVFEPDVSRVVPSLDKEYDLLLLKAGKGKALWERSRTLAEGLPKLDTMDPMEQQPAIMGWTAVLCMVEKAVQTAEGPVPEAWDRELVRLYHEMVQAEESFRLFRALVNVYKLQRGDLVKPLQDLASEFEALTAYSRRGLRWLARKRLPAKLGSELRKDLLRALLDVQRRELDWKGMELSATTLRDLDGKDRAAAAALAEACFELGKGKAGEQALKAAAGADAPLLERAQLRKRLFQAKAAELRAALMVKLGEYERVLKAFSAGQALKLAKPEMDQAYMEALMSKEFDIEAAWDYGQKARGASPTAGFLGRRIGAGLALLMKHLFSGQAGGRLDPGIIDKVQADLELFRKSENRLADLTLLYLEFLRAVAGENLYLAAERMLPGAKAFFERHPDDIQALRIMVLLGQLLPAEQDAWQSVSRYQQARRGKVVEEDFYPLLAGSAIRKAIDSGRQQELSAARLELEKRLKEKTDPKLSLWLAHLLATEAMLQSDPAQVGARLQAVVDAYAAVIQGFVPGGAVDMADMCDAASSVATLMFQAGGLDDARGLLQQVLPVCGGDANTTAVALILELAAGQGAKVEVDMDGELAKLVDHLASRQAQVQTWLWLGSLAEANKDQEAKDKAFSKAAQLIAEEARRGRNMPLAPDRRSVLGLAGQFHMGAGHAVASPFGLAVSVEVSMRMLLFPPAAVDEAKLKPYLEKAKKD